MCKRIVIVAAALVLAAGARGVPAAEIGPDFEALLEDEDEILKSEMKGVEEGDLREFTVVTDDNISTLDVGDIYKSNASFFKVKEIRSKGSDGGRFIVQRTRGKLDPGRRWNRISGLGPPTIVSRETLLDRFLSGGVLMYPIAILLLVAIVITFNSIWVYRRKKHCPPRFVAAARQAIAEGDLDRFEGLALRQKGFFASICRAMVSNFKISTVDDIKSRCETTALQQITLLRTPLKVLNFIASVSPLLGLLGTVIGMIICFDSLAEEAASAGKSQAMAAGIKVALLTTAAGLSVAVPSLLVFFLFNQKLNLIASHCEGLAMEFVHELSTIKRASEGGTAEHATAATDPAEPPEQPVEEETSPEADAAEEQQ